MENPRLDLASRLIAESLNRVQDGWTVEQDFVRGPGGTAVRLAELHGLAPAHLDVGFILDRERTDPRVIWDCTTGIGATEDAALKRAVETWITCTAPVFLELPHGDGRFADHYRANDPHGFSGWHAIHGPFLGWGIGDGKDALQRWALQHPLLPPLRSSIAPSLDLTVPNGVKFFFGSSPRGVAAEVRINGSVETRPSSVLAELSWPRPSAEAYLRAFVLLVHEEPSGAAQIASENLRRH